jgi:hypothetical protein
MDVLSLYGMPCDGSWTNHTRRRQQEEIINGLVTKFTLQDPTKWTASDERTPSGS